MKIVVIASLASSLIDFRGELLRAMTSRGHEVVAAAPDETAVVTDRLAAIGVRFIDVPMSRAGLGPLDDLRTLVVLKRLVRRERADIVLAYTAKPVIYGLIGARLARTRLRVALISGRGSALAGSQGWRRRALASVMRVLYAVALRGAHVVFFQNRDDEALFRSWRLVTRRQRCVLINGSGVDLDHYAPAPLPEGPVTFLMIGRLLREKGVFEFVEAARLLRPAGGGARFRLLGSLDLNPSSISQAALDRLQAEGTVDYLGAVSDVRPAITDAHVIVLPSYHEGMPRSVLEGMSMGRAVITTDEPGCRETVVAGENGFLVPSRDAAALARAMRAFIDDPGLASEMGRNGRRLAEARFDVHGVNEVILEALGLS
jgi:glycosyltransferase involved in cell wall biosynthesis